MECPTCGRRAASSDHFCGWCGEELVAARPETPWTATHQARPTGTQAFAAPDPATALPQQLDPGLHVELVEQADGWSHVRCANGWESWVITDQLLPVEPWTATHRVPLSGLASYSSPAADAAPATPLDPRLEVRVDQWHGAWALVRCSNGWRCWVDGRQLQPLS